MSLKMVRGAVFEREPLLLAFQWWAKILPGARPGSIRDDDRKREQG